SSASTCDTGSGHAGPDLRDHPVPHNREAEAAVLGGILLRNDALNEVVTPGNGATASLRTFRPTARGAARKRGVKIGVMEKDQSPDIDNVTVSGRDGKAEVEFRFAGETFFARARTLGSGDRQARHPREEKG